MRDDDDAGERKAIPPEEWILYPGKNTDWLLRPPPTYEEPTTDVDQDPSAEPDVSQA